MKTAPARAIRRKANRHGKAFFSRTQPRQAAFFAPPDVASDVVATDVVAADTVADVRRRTPGVPPSATAPPGAARALPGGEPLSDSVRTFFEARLGADLRSVRIHQGPQAAASAAALRAQAFTLGENIVFNRDKYAPHTEDGRNLLSHELVHVLQQRQYPAAMQRVQRMPEDQDEQKEPPAPMAAATADKQAAPGATPPEEPGPAKAEEQAAKTKSEVLAEPMSLPDFSTFGQRTMHTDFVNTVTFKGQTDAEFDGGVGQTKNLKAVPAKGCEGCADSECFSVTGTLEITYHVSTTITLPEVPSGLTPCQEKRVREAIDTKISPHEDQHVSAFGTYNGTVKLPINYKGCKEGLADFVQAMHEKDAVDREAVARGKSAALDPFHVNVDLDCEEPPPPKK